VIYVDVTLRNISCANLRTSHNVRAWQRRLRARCVVGPVRRTHMHAASHSTMRLCICIIASHPFGVLQVRGALIRRSCPV
jgi:hypothetical protein